MTISHKQYHAYSVAMQTMPGTKQIVMLYDGVIRYLLQARDAMGQRRIQDRYNNLTRAGEIIFGLQGCLDFERGGEVAQTLYDFYSMVDGRIFGLHRSNDAVACDALIADVKRMRQVWAEIDAAGGSTDNSGIADIAADSGAAGNAAAAPGKASGTDADGMAISA